MKYSRLFGEMPMLSFFSNNTNGYHKKIKIIRQFLHHVMPWPQALVEPGPYSQIIPE